MRKCAVIGAQGYIGKHLVHYLRGCGYEVASYDVVKCEETGYVQCDLTRRDEVAKIDLDVDFLYLFAGLTGTYAGFDHYDRYVDINEMGMLNVLDAIRQSPYRPKVVFPSTRLVYKGQEHALKEDAEKETKTIYAVNKLACEGYLQAYNISFDIPYVVFRICVPFGNMLSSDYSFGTIGFMIRQATEKGMITLYGDGLIRRTFSSMRDICGQIVSGAEHEGSCGRVFNIGGVTHSLEEVAHVVASQYGAGVSFVPYPQKDLLIESGSTFFDASSLESLIGPREYEDVDTLF